MTTDQKLEKLILFLESIGVAVKSDRGDFKGGLVRYHDDKYLYLNRKLDSDARMKLIIKEIREMNLDSDVFDDSVREILTEKTDQ